MSELFRKKSLERISSPEQLDDYIKVTSIPVWIILLGIVVLLAGMLVWGTFGTVETVNADGTTKTVHPITFVTN
jgi:hypothetical protein